jgi:hypothetical protein
MLEEAKAPWAVVPLMMMMMIILEITRVLSRWQGPRSVDGSILPSPLINSWPY